MTAPRVSTREILDGQAPQRVQYFPGDQTKNAVPGMLLGHDDFGRPFEVVQATAESVVRQPHFDGDGCVFPNPRHVRVRTRVELKYATPETLRAALQQRAGGVR